MATEGGKAERKKVLIMLVKNYEKRGWEAEGMGSKNQAHAVGI